MAKPLLLLLFLALLLTIALPAEALPCRTTPQHTICVLEIQRSAKNYWEYRAAVKIDDQKRPIEVYNCRERVRIQADGTVTAFEPGGAGEVICNLFKH